MEVLRASPPASRSWGLGKGRVGYEAGWCHGSSLCRVFYNTVISADAGETPLWSQAAITRSWGCQRDLFFGERVGSGTPAAPAKGFADKPARCRQSEQRKKPEHLGFSCLLIKLMAGYRRGWALCRELLLKLLHLNGGKARCIGITGLEREQEDLQVIKNLKEGGFCVCSTNLALCNALPSRATSESFLDLHE